MVDEIDPSLLCTRRFGVVKRARNELGEIIGIRDVYARAFVDRALHAAIERVGTCRGIAGRVFNRQLNR